MSDIFQWVTMYTYIYSRKEKQHQILFEDTPILAFPKGTDIGFLMDMVSALNGAYNLGRSFEIANQKAEVKK